MSQPDQDAVIKFLRDAAHEALYKGGDSPELTVESCTRWLEMETKIAQYFRAKHMAQPAGSVHGIDAVIAHLSKIEQYLGKLVEQSGNK